jgi:nitrogenase iron protein
MRLAIYGKGGIGKSTIPANLSAAWAAARQRVLQVGCDPKRDSTRLLLGGRQLNTVMDYLRAVPPGQQSLTDIVAPGYAGVHCVEAGGPEPGVGCAGRGILSTFALLERLGLNLTDYDLVLYDVLGDVVCGGFAVPLRPAYTDHICLVTSGEFMSIYAANNILRGVANYEGETPRFAGIILNCRGVSDEIERVRRFAAAVEAPVLAVIPRHELFRQAEEKGRTIIQDFPDS